MREKIQPIHQPPKRTWATKHLQTRADCLRGSPYTSSQIPPEVNGVLDQGTIGCTPKSLPWYLLCSLGILGDNLPINTPRAIRLIVRDLSYLGRGTSNYPLIRHIFGRPVRSEPQGG